MKEELMISYATRYGMVAVSPECLAKLAGHAASDCYGVAGMVAKGAQRWKNTFSSGDFPEKGIKVGGSYRSVTIELHIMVTYGINIGVIAKSIVNKVSFTVEEVTGIKVDKVTVFVEGIKA
ncbi:MAG TPA: Asp23/Gls24 family envelope stress response protein [Ruminococcaceae bacterium]|nr:Asp23/Gls24 family envelope stress response protein [Oscillospiraceae bacterium]